MFKCIMHRLGYSRCYECQKWFRQNHPQHHYCTDECRRWFELQECLGI